MKQRQWWRPVAPIVLEEEVGNWFDRSRPSPFMLEVFTVLADKREVVPAVAHLDGTARVQTLSRSADAPLYDAIAAFRDATGVPLLCNTSLNDRGEPIVDNAVEALNFCIRKAVAVAYVGGTRIALRAAPGAPTSPEDRLRERFMGESAERGIADALAAWAALGFTNDLLFMLTKSPELRLRTGERGSARRVRLAAEVAGARDPSMGEAIRQAGSRPWPPRWDWTEFAS